MNDKSGSGYDEAYIKDIGKLPEIDLPLQDPSPLESEAVGPVFEFARAKKDAQAWEEAREAIARQAVTSNGRISGELRPEFRDIESGSTLEPRDEDRELSSFHIEPLLEQASELLNRCLADRARFDDLSAKWMDLTLELCEYAAHDEIHKREEAAGIYDVPASVSQSDLAAAQQQRSSAQWQEDFIKKLQDNHFLNETYRDAFAGAMIAGWISGLVPYQFSGQTFHNWCSYDFAGNKRNVFEHGRWAAKQQFIRALAVEAYLTNLTRNEKRGHGFQLDKQLPGLLARHKWESENKDFKRERTAASRDVQDQKVKAATAPTGALKYSKRLESMKARFQLDYQSAFARLRAVQSGMQSLYNYREALPPPQAPKHFDECLLWTRKAMDWLARFHRREQSAIIPISLRSQSQQDWEDGLVNKKWSMNFADTEIPNACNIRIRGISAAVETTSDSKSLWRLALKAPEDSVVRYLDGTKTGIKQENLPPVLLARVQARCEHREPDIAGMESLYNASPIGAWDVILLGGVPGSDIDFTDIQIHIAVSYRRTSNE